MTTPAMTKTAADVTIRTQRQNAARFFPGAVPEDAVSSRSFALYPPGPTVPPACVSAGQRSAARGSEVFGPPARAAASASGTGSVACRLKSPGGHCPDAG
jgi:hypothetical protein